MKLLRSYPALSFILVMLSIIGVSLAQRSVELALVAGTLAAMSWFVTEGPRGRSLPRWVSNILVMAVALSAVFDVLGGQVVEELWGIIGRFCTWLTIIKLYERKTPRDHANILLLSLLLMITGCLQSADLYFGIILALYVSLGLYVLLLFQLFAAFENSRAGQTDSQQTPARIAMRPSIGLRVGLHFRMLATIVAAFGVLLSCFVFVTFPRNVGRGIISNLTAPQVSRRTGFSPNVDLTAGSRISASRRSVGFVTVRDDDGNPMAFDEPLFLRGAVLETYEGAGRWRPATGGIREVGSPATDQFTSLSLFGQVSTNPMTLDFEFRTGTEWLFSSYVPVSVSTGDDRVIVFDQVRQILRLIPGNERLYRYQVRVDLDPEDIVIRRLGDAGNRPRIAGPYAPTRRMDLPDDGARRLEALAERVLDDAALWPPPRRADPLGAVHFRWGSEAAQALAVYLQSKPFEYTLDTSDIVYRDPAVEDPVLRFIFETQRGHCEYFASALVALCRSVEIESRLVTGYVAANYDELNERFHLIEANAHAWVEVRTGTFVWSTFDPTPPGQIESMRLQETTITDRLNWAYQGLEGAWASSVVDFNQGSQGRLARSLDVGWSARWRQAIDRLRSWMRRVNEAFKLGPAGYIWMGTVGLAIVLAVIVLVQLMRRSMAIRRATRLRHVRGAEYQRLIRQLGFYINMLRVLSRAGVGKPSWQPPMAFADDLSRQRPDVADIVSQVTDLFYRARYGRSRLSADQMNEAQSLVGRLADILHVRR